MIRYNANAPEILGKPQYDVLRGFGIWNFVSGFFVSFWGVLLIVGIIAIFFMNQNQDVEKPDILPMLPGTLFFFFSAIYSFGIGWGVMRRKQSLPRFVTKTSSLGIVFMVIMCMISCVLYTKQFLAHYKEIDALSTLIKGYLMSSLNMALMIYVFWSIKKTFAATCISNYISKQSNVPENTVGDFGEPRIITLFESWDPLYAYGRFLLYSAIIALLAELACFIHTMNVGQLIVFGAPLPIKKNVVLTIIAAGFSFSLLILVCGYGLTKLKEWARVMNLILHMTFLLLPIIGAFAILLSVDGPIYYKVLAIFAIAFYSVMFFPFFHWCYFVIRTLNSPVVKYVCLRGGHDID